MKTLNPEHFQNFCGSISSVKYSSHFLKDVKRESSLRDIDKEIINPNACGFTELHKFEMKLEGVEIFRAKKAGIHIVYGVTENKDLIFLRAIKNFSEYSKFLANKKLLKEMLLVL